MTPTIRVASSEDLLALVPVLAGYRPERSLVCLAFREDRVVGVLRYDLPGCVADREPLVAAAIGVLCRIPDVDGLMPVTFSDTPFRSRKAGGERALLRLLMRRAREAGFAVRDAICVAAGGWGSLIDPDVPAEGRSLDLIADAHVTAHPAVAGREPGALDDWAALPETTDDEIERVGVALRVLDAEYGVDDDPLLGGVADPVDLVESLLARRPEPDATHEDVARLAWLARLAAVPVARDAMMLQIAFGAWAGRAALAGTGMTDSPGPGEHCAHQPLGRLLLGETAERPDVGRVRSGTAVVLRAAVSARARERAGLLCMASWLAWGLGRGSAAAALLEASLEAEPAHSMARLLTRYFATGALPEWAFQRSGGLRLTTEDQCPTSGPIS